MKKLEINIDDLKYNLNLIKEYAQETQIIAVVKANGMGLDIIKYSKFLIDNGIQILAVATVDEAEILVKSKIDAKILMLSEVYLEEEIEFLIKNNIILTIGSLESKNKIEKISEKINKNVEAHIKIDTGFGRYGFLYTKTEEIFEAIKNTENIKITGVYTHFSKPIDYKWTNKQFQNFNKLIPKIKELNQNIILHCSESTAFLLYPEMNLDAVRLRVLYKWTSFKKYSRIKKSRNFKK